MSGKAGAFELRGGSPTMSFNAESGRQAFVARTQNAGLANALAPIFAAHAKRFGADVRDIALAGADLYEKFAIDTPAAMDQALSSLVT